MTTNPDVYYPDAIQLPLAGHSVDGTVEQRREITLHITQGSTVTGAFETFQSSLAPHRTSCHFIIGQNGTVNQLLPISATAWHSSQTNSHSVGIEHVAIVGRLPASEAQYAASGKLVAWLCGKLHIPADRSHVRTHNEASPRDGHTLCCTGALDPDRVVAVAASILGGATE